MNKALIRSRDTTTAAGAKSSNHNQWLTEP